METPESHEIRKDIDVILCEVPQPYIFDKLFAGEKKSIKLVNQETLST